jgi:ABC-type bacteriocin/lantibiotic exporter with double-glycine peptidase domain
MITHSLQYLPPNSPQGFFLQIPGAKCDICSNLICGIALAFYASWKLTLVVASTMPVLCVCMIMLFVMMLGTNEGDTKEVIEAGKVASESILSVKTVRSLGAERAFQER